MNIYVRAVLLMGTLTLAPAVFAQLASVNVPAHVRSSAAYAEVLLRTTEVRADLEAIAPDHSDNSSRVIDLKSELEIIQKTGARLANVRSSDSSRLTVALGRLLVRKAAIDTELARLMRSYKEEHPEVRKALKRSEIFEAAIKEVLP